MTWDNLHDVCWCFDSLWGLISHILQYRERGGCLPWLLIRHCQMKWFDLLQERLLQLYEILKSCKMLLKLLPKTWSCISYLSKVRSLLSTPHTLVKVLVSSLGARLESCFVAPGTGPFQKVNIAKIWKLYTPRRQSTENPRIQASDS